MSRSDIQNHDRYVPRPKSQVPLKDTIADEHATPFDEHATPVDWDTKQIRPNGE